MLIRSTNSVNKHTDSDYSFDDSTFNFRVNTKLKEEFAVLCGKEHFSVAVALKRYMADCVRVGRIK
jgi:hypothetical protein